MHIICPHCTTSYAIELSTLGVAGRTVRCSRCREVWLARPQDVRMTHARVPLMAESDSAWHSAGSAAPNEPADDIVAREPEPPVVESPSISADLPEGETGSAPDVHASEAQEASVKAPRERRARQRRKASFSFGLPKIGLGTVCAGMAALVVALLIWRTDVVRLLPQTAGFYKLVGLEVNLRGLVFKDVKVSSETTEGKPVLVIEGVIIGEAKKPVELPRLRFSVRDAQGAEIYAWNAVLEQPMLNPGERAWFKSRLASPPAEGRAIDVRFFNKRDLAAGGA
jgi:predicted Zn finger-like uncharacterized protein